jgi:trimethylamine:corrinoid methyltransferase-like protein
LNRKLHAGKKPNSGLGFQVFTDDELNDIHLATLDVLEHTGLFFDVQGFGDLYKKVIPHKSKENDGPYSPIAFSK